MSDGTNGDGGANGAPPSWYAALQGITDEERGWVENKKYGSPLDAIRATRGMEKLLGGPREKLFRIPEEADEAGWGELFGKIGRPEKPEGYGVEGIDAELAAALHKEGLTARQVKNLAATISQRAKSTTERSEAENKARLDRQEGMLKADWGGEYEQNRRHAAEVVQRAGKAIGIEGEKLGDLLEAVEGAFAKSDPDNSYRNTMRFFAWIGRGLGEGKYVEGSEERGGFGMTPNRAKAMLKELEADTAHRAAKFSDVKAIRMAAIEKEMKLREVAFPVDGAQ